MRLINGKLTRWNHYINNYTLPQWNNIPDIGLYMDQVVEYVLRSLDILMIGPSAEPVVTSSAINNYVRLKVMLAPVKKKYGRNHLAYLIMICTLKQSLSIAYIQQLLPPDLTDGALEDLYTRYVDLYEKVSRHFATQVALSTGIPDLRGELDVDSAASLVPLLPLVSELSDTGDDFVWNLVVGAAIIAGFSGLFALKLIDLQGQAFTEEAVIDKRVTEK